MNLQGHNMVLHIWYKQRKRQPKCQGIKFFNSEKLSVLQFYNFDAFHFDSDEPTDSCRTKVLH